MNENPKIIPIRAVVARIVPTNREVVEDFRDLVEDAFAVAARFRARDDEKMAERVEHHAHALRALLMMRVGPTADKR